MSLFPLSVETPTPTDTADAAYFSRDCPPEQLRASWNSQLGKIEKPAQDSILAQQKWDSAIPDGVKPAAVKLKTVAISQRLRQCGIGGEKWIRQFPHGFPITGELSQRCSYNVNTKHYNSMLPRASLASAVSARFKERAAKSGHANAQVLWDEAMEKVGKGRLSQPVPLDESGKPRGWRSPSYSVAFRFGGQQGAKLRSCDDLNHSWANR